jgi:hypothetical protein
MGSRELRPASRRSGGFVFGIATDSGLGRDPDVPSNFDLAGIGHYLHIRSHCAVQLPFSSSVPLSISVHHFRFAPIGVAMRVIPTFLDHVIIGGPFIESLCDSLRISSQGRYLSLVSISSQPFVSTGARSSLFTHDPMSVPLPANPTCPISDQMSLMSDCCKSQHFCSPLSSMTFCPGNVDRCDGHRHNSLPPRVMPIMIMN